MFITCAISQIVPYVGEGGKVKILTLRPGKHNYPMLHPKTDPMLSDTLRVLRKHKKIAFDDLLQSDLELLKKAPKGIDKEEYLSSKIFLAPNPNGRFVSKKKMGVVKDDSRSRHENQTATTSPKDSYSHSKHRKVSDKSEDLGS